MMLVHSQGVSQNRAISIKREIFQGDSLSLHLLKSLKPLSTVLQKSEYGYKVDEKTKFSHLFLC